MDPTLAAFLRSWPLDPWVVAPLLLTAGLYVRGWRELRQRGALRFGTGHLAAFLAGLAAVFLALASPLEAFAGLLLQVHMVQHLLLTMAAPPLLWLGAPLLPLLCGLPLGLRRAWAGPLLRQPCVRGLGAWLTRPLTAWLLFVTATYLWHVPRLYELALGSSGWHHVEHACFLGTALLFWWPVVQPYPSRPRTSRWLLLPYLFAADVLNTVLSAILTFSDRLLYPHYGTVPRLGSGSALDDQAVAGVLMWVPGSLAYLVPLVVLGARLLFGSEPATLRPAARSRAGGRVTLPLVGESAVPPRRDLLDVPWLGRFLRWRHARLALQLPLLALAGLIIWDGLTGPDVAPLNLAGVLPWIHWRGLVVLALLTVGNVFCLACPFLLPRTLARRILPAGWSWPRPLRSKWLAVGLLVLFFGAYEVFALWASPWWTAWIALGYFVAALAVDGLFRGAAFCKYVCPIGQFNFVQSLVAPVEVRVREAARCRDCTTKDCIRGRAGIPGCELGLYLPRKAGNLDCTFCLDCVHACPHDNVGVVAVTPGAELWRDPPRAGLGRLSRRPDVMALAAVLVFAAFANAAAMTAPVVAWADHCRAVLGLASPVPVLGAALLGSILVLPLFLGTAATALGRCWSGDGGPWLVTAGRFALTLVPLGCGMWLAHYGFHLATSAGAAVPALQRFAADRGVTFLGAPAWACSCCAAVAPWVPRAEILVLDLGLLLSLYAGYRVALDLRPTRALAGRAFFPWGVLMVLLFLAGVWIVLQPMEMRGTMEVLP